MAVRSDVGVYLKIRLFNLYATIYYSYQEETTILPTYSSSVVNTTLTPVPLTPVPLLPTPPLLLHARLTDNAFRIWDLANLPANVQSDFTTHMKESIHFGSLAWDVEPPKRSANFLDLTITIQADGSITTKTYVKDMNLHLYIPQTSSHPKGVLKSLVFGNLKRYWTQNSSRDDFVATASDFYGHLINRGWACEALTPVFQEAAANIDAQSVKADPEEQLWDPSTATPPSRQFIHWEYHPRDIGRQAIRQVFNETLAPAMAESGLPVQKLTIAFSTPRSLGQCLTKTRMEEAPSDRVSSYIQTMKHPANL